MSKGTEEVKGKRRKYSREFITEAIKLSAEPGHNVAETARTLGIQDNLLYRWRKQYQEDPANAFPGKGHLKPKDVEIYQLQKELERVRRERDILKKAVAIFSKMPQ